MVLLCFGLLVVSGLEGFGGAHSGLVCGCYVLRLANTAGTPVFCLCCLVFMLGVAFFSSCYLFRFVLYLLLQLVFSFGAFLVTFFFTDSATTDIYYLYLLVALSFCYAGR